MDESVAEKCQLFKTDWCGFCHRVRHFIDQNGVEVALRDVNQDQDALHELLQATGRTTVPCLRIDRRGEVEWMFESTDIMRYLEGHVSD